MVVLVGNYAFSDCSTLTSVVIPDSVTSIGNSAFSDCSGLTSVTIPEGVTSVGNYTFDGCQKLNHINFRGNAPETVGSSAFSLGDDSNGKIHVRPDSCGWDVDIPGTWNGLPIDYGLVFPAIVSVSGTGGVVSGGGDYDEGETAVLRAVPDKGYVLACWEGDVTGGNPEVELPMTRDWTAVATFIPEEAADRLAVERAENNGLYSESQIRAMAAGDLLLELDVATGSARIGVKLVETDDLSDPTSWRPVELTAADLDVGEDGSVGFRVNADGNTRFFRLVIP